MKQEVTFASSTLISRRRLLADIAGASLLALANRWFKRTLFRSRTVFDPKKHGFHFRNDFVNVFVDIGGIHLVTKGRCGGMAYAALDYYFANMSIPSYTVVSKEENNQNQSNTPISYNTKKLTSYIYSRQIDTMIAIWPFGRSEDFVSYTLASDDTLFQWMIRREIEKLRRFLDVEIPVPLGLIGVTELLQIGENHQVVAYKYTVDVASKQATISIYDPNYPDEEVTLFLRSTHPYLHSSVGKMWRGFFVREDYRYRCPPSCGH